MKIYDETGAPVHPVITDSLQAISMMKSFLEMVIKSDGVDLGLVGGQNSQREMAYMVEAAVARIVDFYESLV